MGGYDGHRGSAYYLGVHPEFVGVGLLMRCLIGWRKS